MDTLAILVGIRELLADESRWTRGFFARNRGGVSVDAFADEAVCWCLYGAGAKVSGDQSYGVTGPDGNVLGWWKRIVEATGTTFDIDDWNDAPGRTFTEVKAALDRAIELERGAT